MNALSSPPPNSDYPLPRIPTDLLLSLVTGPWLLTLVISQALSQKAQDLGQLSEELLRGERLPPLSFPQPPKSP
jgi:hypothetical protein